MILYRSVGLQELELIYDSGMKVFPAHLAQQPIFYPVLQLEYARQVATDWNAKNGQFAGYVTQFKVEDDYIGQFEEHTVGETQYQEYWISADKMEEFNRHLVGHIKVVEAHFGDGFQGFIPEAFGLQGKNAVEQFTLLANTFLYKRMDFYLEIRRNHKAIFLNFPFWQIYESKNQTLKGKLLQAIRESWLTSFPNIPLPAPAPINHDPPPLQETDSQPSVDPDPEETPPPKPIIAEPLIQPVQKAASFKKLPPPQPLAKPERQNIPSAAPVESHFVQGVKLGLDTKYREAIEQLTKAVEEDPRHGVAHTSLGVAFHSLGDDDRALSCYETALRIDPLDAEAHYFRANILYGKGRVNQAITGYRIAIGLKPELIEAHQTSLPQDRLTDYTGLPAEMNRIARPAHRILELTRSLETDSSQASLFKERAVEYYRLQNYAQAIADSSSYLKAQPGDASMLHFRGVAYEQMGQLDRAAEDYQRAMSINPQLSDMYIDRGVAFGNMGNFRQSIASLTDSIRLAPKNPTGYFNRGMAYLHQGNFEKARDDFSSVIRLSPADEESYYWRGISNEETGRQGDAIADYRQFLALSQDVKTRAEIEQRLRELNKSKLESVGSQDTPPEDQQKGHHVLVERSHQGLDIYDLVNALGERAVHSTWYCSGVVCYGEKAEELHALTNQNRPIDGRDFLTLTSDIQQTMEGDFLAFDPQGMSAWILIRAWNGSGFYVWTNDPTIKKQLKAAFQSVEDVEGADPPYEGLFIPV